MVGSWASWYFRYVLHLHWPRCTKSELGLQLSEMAVRKRVDLLIVVFFTGLTSVLEPRRVAWPSVLESHCRFQAGDPCWKAFADGIRIAR